MRHKIKNNCKKAILIKQRIKLMNNKRRLIYNNMMIKSNKLILKLKVLKMILCKHFCKNQFKKKHHKSIIMKKKFKDNK
jgi:hypothetical protein